MYSIYFHSSFQANSKTHTFSPIGHASSLNEGRNASTPPPSLQGSHKQPQTTSQASQFGTPMGSNLTAAPSSVRLGPFFFFLLWNYKWFFLQLLILLWCWKIEQFADIDIFLPFFLLPDRHRWFANAQVDRPRSHKSGWIKSAVVSSIYTANSADVSSSG